MVYALSEVSYKLDDLSVEDLKKVREYGKQNKNRETLLEQIAGPWEIVAAKDPPARWGRETLDTGGVMRAGGIPPTGSGQTKSRSPGGPRP